MLFSRRGLGLLSIILISLSWSLPRIGAVETFYGGGLDNPDTWERLIYLNTTIFVSSGDFQHYPYEAEHIMGLADQGVNVNFRVDWWNRLWNGEVAWNTSVVDLFYNSTLMGLLEAELDWIFGFLDMDKIWAVTLSEEGPGASYWYFRTPKQLRKYNETFHSETGYWLRDWRNMNKTEEIILEEWLTQKNTWVFNYLYDYVKVQWPHLQVFQFIFLFPGAPPVWVGGADLSGLKADAHMGDLYFYDVYDNPFWLYEFIRQFKTSYPELDYHIWLWGEEPWTEGGLSGGFDHALRNAWIAYLAGADGIGWFNWHYEHGWIWNREDPLGKRLIAYTNRLNEELEKLPVMKLEPQVLVIRDNMNYQLGLCSEFGVFSEWDAISQRALIAEDLDLSEYRLVVVSEEAYLSEVVERLNEYVRGGGNLLLLGGFSWEQLNFYYNGSRTEFLNEKGVNQEHIWGDIYFNISEPNPLNLTLQYNHIKSSVLGIPGDQLTENHHPIGEFHYLEEGGDVVTEICPLVLYHNASNPGEGSILYWGIPSGPGPTQGEPEVKYKDVVEAFLPDRNYTRYLYRVVTRAFAGNYLRLNGSLAEEGLENMIVTQAEIDEGVILAGLMNFYQESVNITYRLDLSRFDLEPDAYWVHSLDDGMTLGWFESDGSILEIPLEINPQGTRLLLVSGVELKPSYSVDVSPNVPTEEEVEGFWPSIPVEEPEPEPEPEPGPSPEPEPGPEPSPEKKPWVIPGFSYESIVLGIAIATLLLFLFKRKD